jgi:hypothetical protein
MADVLENTPELTARARKAIEITASSKKAFKRANQG